MDPILAFAKNPGALVNLLAIAADVALQQQHNLPRLTLSRQTDDNIWVMGEQEKITAILGHLVQNAQDATPNNGQVIMELAKTSEQAIIKIIDTGCGMDQKFIAERLFKPFDTTKGNAGMGIGVYEARDYIINNQGHCHVDSEPGKGTVFTIRLPLAQPLAGLN